MLAFPSQSSSSLQRSGLRGLGGFWELWECSAAEEMKSSVPLACLEIPARSPPVSVSTQAALAGLAEPRFPFPIHRDFSSLSLWKTGDREGWSTGGEASSQGSSSNILFFLPSSLCVGFCPSPGSSDSLIPCTQRWLLSKNSQGVDMTRLRMEKHPEITQRRSIFGFQREAGNCFYL